MNYSSVRRYVADQVDVYPKWTITKLILKVAVLFDVVSHLFRCALNHYKACLKSFETALKKIVSLGGSYFSFYIMIMWHELGGS